ncbi:MAG: signal peptidase II [Deltaproteobacteria bacterium]|nr:signal peptidase II [Deltaproteobacteria bacterium]
MKKLMFSCLLFLVILVLDQVTKYWAAITLAEGKGIEVIPGLFNFTLVYNRGAAFGMFSQLPDLPRRLILGVVSIIALFVVFRFMLQDAKKDKSSLIGLVMILSGAVGNIIDRFRFDSVVDFLDFYIGTYHWPAFNIADSSICVGVAILLIKMLFFSQASKLSTCPN